MRGSFYLLTAWLLGAQISLAAPASTSSTTSAPGAQSAAANSENSAPDDDASRDASRDVSSDVSGDSSGTGDATPKTKAAANRSRTSSNSMASSSGSAVNAPTETSKNPTTTGSQAVPGTPDGSSTANITAAAKSVKPRRVKGELYSYNSVGVQAAKNSDGNVNATNYLGVRYTLSDRQAVSVRQQFEFDYPQDDEDLKMKAGDLYVRYIDSQLGSFLNDGSIIFIGQVYLPTGETSRNLTKHHGIFNPYFVLSKPLGKIFALEYHLSASWYNQSQNGFINDKGTLSANKDYAVTQFVALGASLGKYWSAAQVVGTGNTWRRPIAGRGVQRAHAAILDTSVTFSGIPKVNLVGGISQETNIYNPPAESQFRLYPDADTSYYLLLSATI